MAHQSSVQRAAVTSFGPGLTETVNANHKEQQDLTPSDSQPPGVDEEREPQSLEEALLGE